MAAKKQTKDRSKDRHVGASVLFRAPKEEMARFRAGAASAGRKFSEWLLEAAHEKLKRQR